MPRTRRKTIDSKQQTLPEMMQAGTSASNNRRTTSPEADCESQLSKWKFPVTIKTFKKFMNYEALLQKYILKYEDKYKCRSEVQDLMLETIYMQYFTMPHKRSKFNLKMRNCNPLVKAMLMDFAKPAQEGDNQDEAMGSTTEAAKGPARNSEHKLEGTGSDSNTSVWKYPVNFNTFKQFMLYDEILEKYVEKYKAKYPEETRLFVEAGGDLLQMHVLELLYQKFYTSPRKRERYGFKVKPDCPAHIKSKLLAFAEKVDAATVEGTASQDTGESSATATTEGGNEEAMESASGAAKEPAGKSEYKLRGTGPDANASAWKYPVNFQTFKDFMLYDEVLEDYVEIYKAKYPERARLLVETGEDLLQMHVLNVLYHRFYTNPRKREKFGFKVKPDCPAHIKSKLLAFAQEIDATTLAVSAREETDESDAKIASEATSCVPAIKAAALSEEHEKKPPEAGVDTSQFPVTLKTFIKYMDYEECLQKIYENQQKNFPERMQKYRDENVELRQSCLQNMYISYFTNPEKRKKYGLKMRPCPASLKAKLLQYAVCSKKKSVPLTERTSGAKIEDGKATLTDEFVTQLLEKQSQGESELETVEPKQLQGTSSLNATSNCANLALKCTELATGDIEHATSEKEAFAAEAAYPTSTTEMLTAEESLLKYPVTLSTFVKCMHYEELLERQVKAFRQEYPILLKEKGDDLEKQLLENIYVQFYTNPSKREEYALKMKACPALLKTTLLQFATQKPHVQREVTSSEDTNPMKRHLVEAIEPAKKRVKVYENADLAKNNLACVSIPRSIVVENNIEHTPIRAQSTFPVSLATFKRHMHYEMYLEKMLETANKHPELIQKWQEMGTDSRKLFLRVIYFDYFTKPEKRKKFGLTMKPCPKSLKQKLMQFVEGTVSIEDDEEYMQTDDSDCQEPKPIFDAAKELDSTRDIACNVKETSNSSTATCRENNMESPLKNCRTESPNTICTDEKNTSVHVNSEVAQSVALNSKTDQPSETDNTKNLDKSDKSQELKENAEESSNNLLNSKLITGRHSKFFTNDFLRRYIQAKGYVDFNVCTKILQDINQNVFAKSAKSQQFPAPATPIKDKVIIQSVLIIPASKKGKSESETVENNKIEKNISKTACAEETKRAAITEKKETKKASKAIEETAKSKAIKEARKAKEIEEAEKTKAAEEAAKAKAIEEAAKAKAIEEAAKAKAIEEARKAKEIEEARKAKEIEEAKKAKEIDEARKAKEIKEAKKAKAAEEAAKAKAIEEAAKAKAIEEAAKAKAIEEARKAKEIEEAKKAKEIEEAAKAKEIEEAKKAKAIEEAAKTKAIEEAAKTKAAKVAKAVEEANQVKAIKEASKVKAIEEQKKAKTFEETVKARASGKAKRVKPAEEAKKAKAAEEPVNKSEIAVSTTESEKVERRIAEIQSIKYSKFSTLTYALLISVGLKKRVLEAILEMSFEEYCKYVNIYSVCANDADLLLLEQHYQYTFVKQKIWPIDLYMEIADVVEYLLSKNVVLQDFNLSMLSPKLLHWSDLCKVTNYDDCVLYDYYKCNGEHLKPEQLTDEQRIAYYNRCWIHEQWILRVPLITDEQLKEQIAALIANHEIGVAVEDVSVSFKLISVKELCSRGRRAHKNTLPATQDLFQSSGGSSTNRSGNNQISGSAETVSSTENYIDMPNTQNQIDALPTECCLSNDPLSPSPTQLDIGHNHTNNHDSTELCSLAVIKKEPKPLDKLQFNLSDNEEDFVCLPVENSLILLDESSEQLDELFDFRPPYCQDSTTSMIGLITQPSGSTLSAFCEAQRLSKTLEAEENVVAIEDTESVQSDEVANELHIIERIENDNGNVEFIQVGNTQISAEDFELISEINKELSSNVTVRKKKTKKASANTDMVPQKTHEFRPLTLARINKNAQSEENAARSRTPSPHPCCSSSLTKAACALTASQALATDNSLFNNTELLRVVDQPRSSPSSNSSTASSSVTTTTTTSDAPLQVNTNATAPRLYKIIRFCKLLRFDYFRALSTDHIVAYSLPTVVTGQSYMQALILHEQKSKLYGNMLWALFPNYSKLEISAVYDLLNELDEYHFSAYAQRDDADDDNSDDADWHKRKVLDLLFSNAPMACNFSIKFDCASQEYGQCVPPSVQRADEQTESYNLSLLVTAAIKPSTLERMAKLKKKLEGI